MGVEIIFEERFKDITGKLGSVAEARLLEAANEVRNTTLETLSGTRTGRTYKVTGTSRTYTASAPGEPPAVQLGDLRKSVKAGVDREGGSVFGYVGTELLKGPMLELGTTNMEPRPWLRPSFEKSLDKIKDILTRVWF